MSFQEWSMRSKESKGYMLLDLLQCNLNELRKRDLRKIHIAVLDTGIDATHEVLKGKVIHAYGFRSESDGTIASFKLSTNSDNDSSGHGTGVASIITTLAPNAVISDYKVLDGHGSCTGKTIVTALQMAIDSDAQVINLSLTIQSGLYWESLVKLLEQAYLRGKIVIAAKRNMPLPEDLGLPAELSSCIGVDNKYFDHPFLFQFLKNSAIEFAADGMNMQVAKNGGGYHRMSGTSFATPVVTAIVSLLLGVQSDLTLFEIKTLLKHQQMNKAYRHSPNHLEYMNACTVPADFSVPCKCPRCGCQFEINDLFEKYLCPVCEHPGKRLPLLSMELLGLVEFLFTQNQSNDLLYHNLSHTRFFLNAVYDIFRHIKSISAKQKKMLIAAALFHDTGYLTSREKHEQYSCKNAEQILPHLNWNEQDIAEVKRLITATEPGHIPTDLPEKIMHDADYYHIGTPLYGKMSKLLLLERQKSGRKMTVKQWEREETEFLTAFHFYLPFLEKERKAARTAAIETLTHHPGISN